MKFGFVKSRYINLAKKIYGLFLGCKSPANKKEKKLETIISAEKEEKVQTIISMYNGILYRDPEPGAIKYWISFLERGHTIDDILKEFFESEEFLGIKANNLNKLYVPPGHFYSPIVDVNQVNKIFNNKNTFEDLPGIKIDKNMMLDLWEKLQPYIKTTPFPEKKTNSGRYYFLNPAFSYSDGIILSAILQHFKPNNIIEIGSGYSSACTLDTINKYFTSEVNVTFIEPYSELLKRLIGDEKLLNINLIEDGIQQVDLSLFSRLEKNDILFIDSTHVIKTGSDVCCELFEILPSLKSGVLVHFHDVFWPFEYPKDWVLSDNRSWNEIYGLRAFLMNNSDYEIIFFNDYFCKFFKQIVEQDYPKMLKNTGGSLWLRKR